MNKKEMQKRLAAILDEMQDLLDAGLDDESRTEYDTLEGEVETLRADLERLERQESRQSWANQPETNAAPKTRIEMGNAPEDREFASLGECAHAIIRSGMPHGKIDPRLVGMNHRAATGLGENVPADGGFLLEESYVSGIMKRVYDSSEIINGCQKITVGNNSNSITLKAIDESSRVDGSRLGGVRGYWRDEAATVTASDPKFRNMKIDLNSLMAICYLTDELLDDVSALNSFIPQAFADELEFKLADAIINGDGVGKPLGVANSGALVSVTKESGQAAASLVPANAAKMFSRMWARSRGNAKWYINQDVEPQLWTMTLDAGTAGFPVYLPPGGYSQTPYGSLFGRPVVPVEFAQTLGTTGDVQLLDLSQYVLAVKGGMSSAWSMHVKFLYAEQTFRISMRVGGQPVWDSVLTPFKGSNTASPFVWLAARS